MALDLKYTNFKSGIRDNARYNLYMGIWSRLKDGVSSGAFGTKAKKDKEKVSKSYGSYGTGRSDYWYSSVGAHSQRSFSFEKEEPRPNRILLDEDIAGQAAWEDHKNDPFFWDDGMGHTSNDASDDENLDDAGEVEGADGLQFDSIEEVIKYFSSKD